MSHAQKACRTVLGQDPLIRYGLPRSRYASRPSVGDVALVGRLWAEGPRGMTCFDCSQWDEFGMPYEFRFP